MLRGADRQHIRRFQTLENGIQGRFGEHKIRLHIFDDLIAVGILCTENGAALFTRMQVVEDVTGGTLQQVVDEAVAPGSKIECDGYRFNRRKTGDRSSCAWQEPSPHLALSCIKPISKFQNMTTSAQRQKTPRDPTSGIAGVRGEDLRFRPLSGALGGFPADGREKGRQHGEESRAESGGGAGRSGRV